jgi:hypothetical protein
MTGAAAATLRGRFWCPDHKARCVDFNNELEMRHNYLVGPRNRMVRPGIASMNFPGEG